MITPRITAALSRIDWKLQHIRLRKILTATLVSTLMVVIGPAVDLVTAPAANAAASTSSSSAPVLSSTGGGGLATSQCAAGYVLSTVSTEHVTFDSTYALTQVYGVCRELSADGLSKGNTTSNTREFGGSSDDLTRDSSSCGSDNSSYVIVGAQVYKTQNGYAAGVQLICATLPTGKGPDGLTGKLLGKNPLYGTQSYPNGYFDEIRCAAGTVAIGLHVYEGGILDRFGLICGYVTGATQTITFGSLANKTYGDSVSLSATSSSDLSVTFSSATTSVCTVSGTSVTLVATGTCTINANQAGNTTWASAQVQQSFQVAAAAALTPTFGSVTKTAGGFTVPINNYNNSYNWAGTASAGVTVTVSGTGLVTVTGLAAGASETISISTTRTNYNTGTGTVTGTALSSRSTTFGTATRQSLGFTVPISNYDASFTYESVTASAGTATLSGSNIVVTGLTKGAGATVSISTRKTDYISATFTSSSFYALETATAFSLNAQTLTVGGPYKVLYSADASNPNKPTYTSSTTSVCTVSGETITPLTAGTCSISASLSGYSTYDTITATRSYTVNAAPTFVALNILNRTYASAATTYQVSATLGVSPYTYKVVRKSTGETITGITINSTGLITVGEYVPVGVETVTVTVTDANGVTFSRDGTFTIFKKNPVFTITASGETTTTVSKPLSFTITTAEYGITGTVSLSFDGSKNMTECLNLDISSGTATCTWNTHVSGINQTVYLLYSGNSNYSSKGITPAAETSFGVGPTVTVNQVVTAYYETKRPSYGVVTSYTPISVQYGTGPRSAWSWSIVRASDSSTVSGFSVNQETVTVAANVAPGTYYMVIMVTDAKGVTSHLTSTVIVGKGNPLIGLSVESSSVTVGKTTRITVTAGAPGVTGIVKLYIGSTSSYIAGCESITLVNSVGTCDATSASVYGPVSISYDFAGDSNYLTQIKTTTVSTIQFFPRTSMVYGTLTTNFGTAASLAGTYSTRGGGASNLWTWSIVRTSDSSTVSGITMNGETITVSSTVNAGTYSMTIVTTDGLGDVTHKNVTITVNPLTGLTSTFGTVTRTANGFAVSINNYSANYIYTVTTSAGTVESGTASGSSLPLTITGLGDSASATITVTTTRVNYTTVNSTVSGTSLAVGLVPTFGTVTKTATGFTVTISNYSAGYTWTESVTAGSVSAGVASGSNRTYTVTGLSTGQSATLYVSDTSTTTRLTSGSITGSTLLQQSAVTVTTTSGTYPGETLTATGGSGTGALTFALAGPSTNTLNASRINKTVNSGAFSQYSPDGSMLYILNSSTPSSTLLRFVVSSETFLTEITMPANSKQFAIASDSSYVLIVSPTRVTKVLSSTGETSTVVSSGLNNAQGISIDPTGTGDFYVSDTTARKILGFYSNGTSKFSTTVSMNASNDQSTNFGRSAITADGSKLYVIGVGTDAGLYEFNTSTGAKTNEVSVTKGTSGLNALAITSNGLYAFTTSSSTGRLYRIDLTNWSVRSGLLLQSNNNATYVSISSDSSFVIASVEPAFNSYYQTRVYSVSDFTQIDSFSNDSAYGASSAVAPDGKTGYLIESAGLRKFTFAWGSGSAGCSVSGTRVSAKAAGTCKVVATKAADVDYLVETSTVTTFTFNAATALKVSAVGATVNYGITSKYTPKVTFTGFVSTDTGTVTSPVYNYAGINGTTYSSSTVPTAVGTYSVTPSGGTIALTSGYIAGYATPVNYVSDTLTVQATVPDSVTALSAVSTSPTAARITFTAPANTGGTAITAYIVSNNVDTVTVENATSPITFSGLSPGAAYVFRVNAINAVGRSETASATSITMPLAVAISPSTTTATYGVAITPIVPTVTGGSGITYSVTPALPAGLTLNSNGSISGTPTETLTVRTYTETATATGTSGSSTFTLSISKASSAISVPTITPLTPILGSAITFTSTVTSVAQVTLTGTVTFKNASNTTLCSTSTISSGVASCDYTPITTDTFTVRAYYGGMTYIETSTSLTALTVVPSKGNPSVTLAASSVKILLGSTTTLTTTVVTGTATNATGQVVYTANTTTITGCSSVNVSSNSATCSFTPTTAGVFQVLATYVGDANFNGVVASTLSITVSSCTQSSTGLTLSVGAPASGYCAVSVTAGTSGSLGLPVGVVSMKSQVLVIGGGGSGGPRHGGGGGAGSLLYSDGYTISDTTTVTIGAGGAATSVTPTTASNNGKSTVFGAVTASGGGAGGGINLGNGYSGGSGGGGASTNSGSSGSQSSVSGFTSYVNSGGSGTSGGSQANFSGGGGGGAGSGGFNGTGSGATPGKGGNGLALTMTLDGSSACFAAGGGGGSYNANPGGVGGGCFIGSETQTVGGVGNKYAQNAGEGSANTGSGGGGGGFEGGGNYNSGAGGSGLVALRYISPATITVPVDTTTASLTTINFIAIAPIFTNLFTRTYQWQKYVGSSWVSDTSTSATTLILTFVAHYGEGTTQKYRLLVTDSDGMIFTTTASRTITLTVTPLTQPTLYLGSTYAASGTSLPLFTYGGAGSGVVTYSFVSSGSAAGCALTNGVLSLSVSGICKIVATKAADLDYLIKRSETTTVSFVTFQIAVQQVPTNTSTGIYTPGSTTTEKGSSACTVGCVPKITLVAPYTGRVGDSIVLTGINFTGTTKVIFNVFTLATTFTVASDTQITVVIPAGLSAGETGIEVVATGGTSVRNFDLEIL